MTSAARSQSVRRLTVYRKLCGLSEASFDAFARQILAVSLAETSSPKTQDTPAPARAPSPLARLATPGRARHVVVVSVLLEAAARTATLIL
jgi:hypothetical protein